MKRLVVLAGPNGSGKSTLFHLVKLAPDFPETYINPDEIVRLEDFAAIPVEAERYHLAMDYAEELRNQALKQSEPLAFETVLSKPACKMQSDKATLSSWCSLRHVIRRSISHA